MVYNDDSYEQDDNPIENILEELEDIKYDIAELDNKIMAMDKGINFIYKSCIWMFFILLAASILIYQKLN